MQTKFANPRLLFPIGEQNKFIIKVIHDHEVSLDNFAKVAKVSNRTIRDWKGERYHMTESAIKLICKKFKIRPPSNIKQLKTNWKKLKSEVCKRNATTQYKIYGNFSTPAGRIKGGHNALEILRKRGLAAWVSKPYKYPRKSKKLAEFVGIMLGDGGITKEQATITLNTNADKKYIHYVCKLCKALFGQKPKIAPRNDCLATNLRYSGINLVSYLLGIGLKSGDKVKQQVGVPSWINNSQKYKIACLRGLMDTDGCISKCAHRYKGKKYVYLNPCFANRSKPLLNFVTDTLSELKLDPSVAGERIWLYNRASVQNYFKIVGSSNYRLLKFKKDIIR